MEASTKGSLMISNRKIIKSTSTLSNFTLASLALLALALVGCGGDDSGTATNPTVNGTITSPPFDTTEALESGPEVSEIVPAEMDSTLVSVKQGIWADDLNKASMWSEYVELDAGVTEYYVSPTGSSSNTGANDSPWSLDYALGRQAALPGNTIVWLKDGDYVNPNSTTSEIVEFVVWLEGEAGKPIHIRPEHGAHVRIDGGLTVLTYSKHIRIWDIHMTTVGAADWRPSALPQGSNIWDWTAAQGNPARPGGGIEGGSDIKYINTTMNKLSAGAAIWKNAANSELYGSIIFDNGWTWTEPDGDLSGSGPGMYIQNSSGTPRTISDNIVAGFRTTGIQIKPDDLEISDHFTVTGNVWFAPTVNDFGRGYLSIGVNGSKDLHFNKNFIHGTQVYMPGLWGGTYVQTSEHECNNNHFYRTDTAPAFTCDYGVNEDVSDPNETANTLTKAFLRPNKYDPRRANLMVLNGERKPALSVDLGTFVNAGEKVAVLNSLDPYGEPIAIGVYNGTYFNINWPTSDWEIEPVSNALTKDLNTVGNEFWTFVIIKID